MRSQFELITYRRASDDASTTAAATGVVGCYDVVTSKLTDSRDSLSAH